MKHFLIKVEEIAPNLVVVETFSGTDEDLVARLAEIKAVKPGSYLVEETDAPVIAPAPKKRTAKKPK